MDDILRRFFFHFPHEIGRDRSRLDEDMETDDPLNSRKTGDADIEDDHFRWNSSPTDEIFLHFEQMVNSLFAGTRLHSGLPGQDNSVSLRDRLLKRSQPRLDDGGLQNGLERDMDLDGAVSTFGLPGVDEPARGHTSSFFSSTTITIREGGEQRKVEERRTQWDSHGNEETVVTRRLGDREHRVVTRRDGLGVREHQEDLVDIDERSVGEFDARWASHQVPNDSSALSLTPEIFGGDATAPTLFTKLFGTFMSRVKPSQ